MKTLLRLLFLSAVILFTTTYAAYTIRDLEVVHTVQENTCLVTVEENYSFVLDNGTYSRVVIPIRGEAVIYTDQGRLTNVDATSTNAVIESLSFGVAKNPTDSIAYEIVINFQAVQVDVTPITLNFVVRYVLDGFLQSVDTAFTNVIAFSAKWPVPVTRLNYKVVLPAAFKLEDGDIESKPASYVISSTPTLTEYERVNLAVKTAWLQKTIFPMRVQNCQTSSDPAAAYRKKVISTATDVGAYVGLAFAILFLLCIPIVLVVGFLVYCFACRRR